MIKHRFSQFWYRVEKLRPKLRSHVNIHRHFYRGEIWYVLEDLASGKVHRFSENAYTLIGRMDGTTTVQTLWEQAGVRLQACAPTQDETIHLLGQLHGADLLHCDVPPDAMELFNRSRREKMARKKQAFLSPLAIRIPLFDPDRLFAVIAPWAAPFFSVFGFLLWLLIVATALFFALQHWDELSRNVLDRVMSPQNLFLMWCLFPLIKLFHELGHGISAKLWGAEVHEMGIMLLVFTPVPYINVSTSAAFRQKFRRLVVAASGMMVELVIAAAALFLWITAEPGWVRNCAYNTLFIAGVSTLLFNSNPLIRFDGYYILSDLLEIPNLAQRSNAHIRYLVTRYAFGLTEQEPPVASNREKCWFLFYAPASWLYRLFIITGIGLFLAQKFLILGAVVTGWSLLSMLVLPLFKGIRFLLTHYSLRSHRTRAILVSASTLAVFVLTVFYLPLPLRTLSEGVVWLPESSFVRGGTDGFVQEMAVPSGSRVSPGEILIRNEDPVLEKEEKVSAARLEELMFQHREEQLRDRVQAALLEEEIVQEQARRVRLEERMRDLNLVAGASGLFVVPGEPDLPGRYIRQGETLGYIFPETPVIVRVVLLQEDVERVRHRLVAGQARLARDLDSIHPVSLVREVPAGQDHLPSRTLSIDGGGSTVTDPREQSGTKTFQKTFHIDLQLPLSWSDVHVGDRVYIRFDHGYEPLAMRWWRFLRQLFLARLDV